MMQNNQLHFFDIILCVDNKPVLEGNPCEKSPQEILDSLLFDKDNIKLTVSRESFSLQTTQDFIAGKFVNVNQ